MYKASISTQHVCVARRSLRVPTRNQPNCEHHNSQYWIKLERDREGFESQFINSYIGRGVFATEPFKMGDFLLEYRGELISGMEGRKREKAYDFSVGNFLFFYEHKGASYCIDATFSNGHGRLVNDQMKKKANSVMKKVIVDGTAHLCLFAQKDVSIGEELRYDYGVPDLPWRTAGAGTKKVQKANLDERDAGNTTSESQAGGAGTEKAQKANFDERDAGNTTGAGTENAQKANFDERDAGNTTGVGTEKAQKANFDERDAGNTTVESHKEHVKAGGAGTEKAQKANFDERDAGNTAVESHKEHVKAGGAGTEKAQKANFDERDAGNTAVESHKEHVKAGGAGTEKAQKANFDERDAGNTAVESHKEHVKAGGAGTEKAQKANFDERDAGNTAVESHKEHVKAGGAGTEKAQKANFDERDAGNTAVESHKEHVKAGGAGTEKAQKANFDERDAGNTAVESHKEHVKAGGAGTEKAQKANFDERDAGNTAVESHKEHVKAGGAGTEKAQKANFDERDPGNTTSESQAGGAGTEKAQKANFDERDAGNTACESHKEHVKAGGAGTEKAQKANFDERDAGNTRGESHKEHVKAGGAGTEKAQKTNSDERDAGNTACESHKERIKAGGAGKEKNQKGKLDGRDAGNTTPEIDEEHVKARDGEQLHKPLEFLHASEARSQPCLGIEFVLDSCEESEESDEERIHILKALGGDVIQHRRKEYCKVQDGLPKEDNRKKLRPPKASTTSSNVTTGQFEEVEDGWYSEEEVEAAAGTSSAFCRRKHKKKRMESASESDGEDEGDELCTDDVEMKSTELKDRKDIKRLEGPVQHIRGKKYCKDGLTKVDNRKKICQPKGSTTSSNVTTSQFEEVEDGWYSEEEEEAAAGTSSAFCRRKHPNKRMESALESSGEDEVDELCTDDAEMKSIEAKDRKDTKCLEVFISEVTKSVKDSRVYDKRQACFYCDKLYAKIARHYEQHHINESEVARAFGFQAGSHDRKKALEKLRLQGNFHHNLHVLESKSGQLIVMRRPGAGENCSQDDFLPCIHCLGFVKKKELWRHTKVCTFKKADVDEDHEKYQKLQTKSKMLILPSICAGKSSLFQDVIASMRSDDITLVARNDYVISTMGSMLAEKGGARRFHDISQKMRSLARLLLELRETENNTNAQLLELLCPDKFDVVVQCVKQLSKFNEKQGQQAVDTPSLALRLGHALKQCAHIARGRALREKNKYLLEDIDHFEKLMDAEWNYRVSHHSLATLDVRKYNQHDLLPVTSDLQKLREFITAKINSLVIRLKEKPLLQTWRELSEFVLNRLILFNKRRGGETAKLLLETYKTRPNWGKVTNEDVIQSLSEVEQQLFKRLDMVEVRGKRGRKVPILLTKEAKCGIDILVEKRAEVGICSENPYIFATAGGGGLGHLSPWECLRKVATNEELALSKPEAVTSTKLRKYVATVSQILDLQENELDWLARHLGHDIQVHRQYYRLHDSTIELAKVSKILTTVDQGKTGQWAGKSLDEIDIDDIEPIEDGAELQGGEVAEAEEEDGLQKQPQKQKKRKKYAKYRVEEKEEQEEQEEGEQPKKKKKKAGQKPKSNSNSQQHPKENSGRRNKKMHQIWTSEEKEEVFKFLGDFIKRKTLPGKRECEICLKKSSGVLKNRDWTSVKYYVKNVISRAKVLKEKN